MAGRVLYAGGEFKMWYTGVDSGNIGRIGYATSPDGLVWAKYPGNPVLVEGAGGDWDDSSVMIPSVIFNGTGYQMWFGGQDASSVFRIGYATSPDGITWTKDLSNPVLEPTPGGWDESMVSGPFTIFDGSTYHMWYSGFNPGGGSGIGYAYSVSNIAPTLSGGSVSPFTGPRNARFTYNVTYRDEDNDPPAYVRVWINKSGVPFGGSPYDLKFGGWKGIPDDWVAGANYSLSVYLYYEGSDYTFAFSASDGTETVFLPERWGPDVTTLSGVEKIAWMSDRSGNWDIWVMDADGSNPVQLTTDPVEDWFPDWSPGADRILFASWRTGNSDIWVMDADGSNQTQLTTNVSGDFNPVWSPDGTRIAFNSRRDGPDSDVWVMDADGSNLVPLTTDPGDDRQPSWSPDGSKIVFSSDRTVPANNNIWVMDADGSNKTQIQAAPNYDLDPDWSPGGSKIAWMTRRSGEHDIWVMDPDGSNQTQLTTHPEEDGSPSWSCDSGRIAYYSVQLGNPEIFVMDADGSNQTQVTMDSAWDVDPDFALIPVEEPPLPPTLLQAVLVGASLESVEITWNAAPDDGWPSGTVKYEIWRASSLGGPYSYLDEMVAGGIMSYSYVDSGAGHGDPSNYFYKVRSVNEAAKWNETNETVGKFARQLPAGVSFISIPLQQVDESLETVLQTLTYDRAWHYDSVRKEWRYYAWDRAYKTDLGGLDLAMGLWVDVTTGSTLTVAGMVPSDTIIQLSSGWNMIGYPSFNLTYTVADLKAATGATRVEAYYAPGLPYCLRVLEDFEVLQAGEAYWVRVNAPVDWIVDES
jgi:Tol biopolymer transport system component